MRSSEVGQRESTVSFYQLQQWLPLTSHLPARLPSALHGHLHRKTESNGSNGSDGSAHGHGRVHNPNRDSATSFAFVGYENTPPGLHHDINFDVDLDLEHQAQHQNPHGRMSSEETLLDNPHDLNKSRSTKESDLGESGSGEDEEGEGDVDLDRLAVPRKEGKLGRMASYESYEDPYYRSS